MLRQTLEYHPVIGYRFIPGLKARITNVDGGYLIQVNESGFRCNHDYSNLKTSGIRRILLFGDSYTAGDGVSNDKRYGDILEREIPQLEVFNYGLPGTGTDQQYLTYKEFAHSVEHDLLVIAVFVENIRRVVAHYRYYFDEKGNRVCFAKPYFELREGKLILKNVPPPPQPIDELSLPKEERETIDRGAPFATIGKLLGKWGVKDLVQKKFHYQPQPEYEDSEGLPWKLMQAILEQWISNHSKPVILTTIPRSQYLNELADPSHYQERFRMLASATNCTFHDPLPDLLKYSLSERHGFYLKEGHFNSRGHQALAESIIPVISRLLDHLNPLENKLLPIEKESTDG
jgi:carbamoyltransferase